MVRFSVLLIVILALCPIRPLNAADPAPAGGLTVRMVQAMDTNRDGVITRNEFLSVSRDEALWTRLDRDGDGVLDKQELRRGIHFSRHTRH